MGLLISLYLNRSIRQVSNVSIIKIQHNYFVVSKSVKKYVIKIICSYITKSTFKRIYHTGDQTTINWLISKKLACYFGPEVIQRQHDRSNRELNCVNVRLWGLTVDVGKQPGRGPNCPWLCILSPTIREKRTTCIHSDEIS